MGIFTPTASDLDLALVAAGFVVIGFIIAYVVVPFAICLAGTHRAHGEEADAATATQHFTLARLRRR